KHALRCANVSALKRTGRRLGSFSDHAVRDINTPVGHGGAGVACGDLGSPADGRSFRWKLFEDPCFAPDVVAPRSKPPGPVITPRGTARNEADDQQGDAPPERPRGTRMN